MNNNLTCNLPLIAATRGLMMTKDGSDVVNQSAIEGLTGVPQTTISGILVQGKMPRVDTLEKLAKGLGVDLWLMLAPTEVLQASLEPGFSQLLTDYCTASSDGRQKIRLVAASQAVLADVNL